MLHFFSTALTCAKNETATIITVNLI